MEASMTKRNSFGCLASVAFAMSLFLFYTFGIRIKFYRLEAIAY